MPVTASQQKLIGRLYFVSDGLRCCCVRPMCVSEDKTGGSPR